MAGKCNMGYMHDVNMKKEKKEHKKGK